jgi:hypothetical protein
LTSLWVSFPSYQQGGCPSFRLGCHMTSAIG